MKDSPAIALVLLALSEHFCMVLPPQVPFTHLQNLSPLDLTEEGVKSSVGWTTPLHRKASSHDGLQGHCTLCPGPKSQSCWLQHLQQPTGSCWGAKPPRFNQAQGSLVHSGALLTHLFLWPVCQWASKILTSSDEEVKGISPVLKVVG